MALLTNEQIAELIGIASNQSTSQDLFIEFYDWNEKQTGVQVNVDWDKHAKESQHAALRLHFIVVENDSALWSDSKEIILINRPKPVITPHLHAEMIMKYAEVAQKRVDPWVEFEWGKNDSHWCSCDRWINFNTDNCYRHIGETK